MEMVSTKKFLFVVALIFYLIAGAMLYKGYDKVTNYYNSEYSTANNVNAYVGGDAYTYIINGNYSTGFFVLSMGFMNVGSIFLSSALILGHISKSSPQTEDIVNTHQG